jgi:hypothetical protein
MVLVVTLSLQKSPTRLLPKSLATGWLKKSLTFFKKGLGFFKFRAGFFKKGLTFFKRPLYIVISCC